MQTRNSILSFLVLSLNLLQNMQEWKCLSWYVEVAVHYLCIHAGLQAWDARVVKWWTMRQVQLFEAFVYVWRTIPSICCSFSAGVLNQLSDVCFSLLHSFCLQLFCSPVDLMLTFSEIFILFCSRGIASWNNGKWSQCILAFPFSFFGFSL